MALISLTLNFKYDILLHQIGRNPILYQEIDPAYWLFMFLDLPDFFTGQMALLLDIILIISSISGIIWNNKTILAWVFFIAHFIYFILYNMMAGHHYINIGLLIISFPFIFCNKKSFAYAFVFCRFIFCFMMMSAALWKITRGGPFYQDQLYNLLQYHNVQYLIDPVSSLKTETLQFLINNKLISHFLWILIILLEFIFFLGFINFRNDKTLLFAYLLFFGGGWFLMGIYNFENLVFLLTLYPSVYLMKRINFKYLLKLRLSQRSRYVK